MRAQYVKIACSTFFSQLRSQYIWRYPLRSPTRELLELCFPVAGGRFAP